MNTETRAIESEELTSTEQGELCTLQQTGDIEPLPLEAFKLVGGGGSIVVF